MSSVAPLQNDSFLLCSTLKGFIQVVTFNSLKFFFNKIIGHIHIIIKNMKEDFCFASCLDFFEKSDLIFTLYSLAME